jgi:hypothetical protein
MVSDLGNHGYRQQALQLLDVAEEAYRKQSDVTLTRPRSFFDEKIIQLRYAINTDLKR